jgi:hypothetical protein
MVEDAATPEELAKTNQVPRNDELELLPHSSCGFNCVDCEPLPYQRPRRIVLVFLHAFMMIEHFTILYDYERIVQDYRNG